MNANLTAGGWRRRPPLFLRSPALPGESGSPDAAASTPHAPPSLTRSSPWSGSRWARCTHKRSADSVRSELAGDRADTAALVQHQPDRLRTKFIGELPPCSATPRTLGCHRGHRIHLSEDVHETGSSPYRLFAPGVLRRSWPSPTTSKSELNQRAERCAPSTARQFEGSFRAAGERPWLSRGWSSSSREPQDPPMPAISIPALRRVELLLVPRPS